MTVKVLEDYSGNLGDLMEAGDITTAKAQQLLHTQCNKLGV